MEEPRYADAPGVEVARWIAATPERVWELISDVRRMPELSDELQEAEWLGAGGPAVGATFRGRSRHSALGEWSTTSHVVECEAGRVFAWAVEDPDAPAASWRFHLEPVDGGTRLTQRAQLGPGRSGLSLAIDRTPEKETKIVAGRLREFEQYMTDTLARVAALVEA
ncbi:SRPBCC family protein [Salinifilum ghardaiensis]